ncbi:MAG TPA: diacylglycerol kinase [Mesorhizobium sp.]|nr:diacylglycerol kinase [Mesorhizobium sp.]
MLRLIHATQHSARAFGRLLRSETAFQQEMALLAFALPLAWLLADTWHGYAILIGSVLFLIMVEILNTAVEAACNAVSREFRPEIQLAKDCGSLAVAFAIFLAGGVWLFFLLDWWHGAPI